MRRGSFLIGPASILLLVGLILPGAARGADIYVPDDHATIQAAIGAAAAGDTIIVRAGTYVENIDFLGKAVTVVSEKGPWGTVIDGGGAGTVVLFENGEGSDSVLDGFTVTNGLGPGAPDFHGGGITCLNSSPTIRNNIVAGNNSVTSGGGMHLLNSSAYVHDNTINENFAGPWPGGAGETGGGIHCDRGAPVITSNQINDNGAAHGGGIFCLSTSVMLSGNLIARNRAANGDDSASGGGIGCEGGSAIILNNLVRLNGAEDMGGGVFGVNWGGTLVNNTILSNEATTGGGLCSLVDPAYPATSVVNTIIWGNRAGQGMEMAVDTLANPHSLSIRYSDVRGGQAGVFVGSGCVLNWGAGMIEAYPYFINCQDKDYHLSFKSPCRDAGDSVAAALPLTDMDGNPRVAGAAVDIGADEFYFELYKIGQVEPGATIMIKVVGWPDMPVTLAVSPELRDPPYPTAHGDFMLATPIRVVWSFPRMPAEGVVYFPVTVPTAWSSGDDYHLQALVGRWGGANTRLTDSLTLLVK